jgi:hypothetical protein
MARTPPVALTLALVLGGATPAAAALDPFPGVEPDGPRHQPGSGLTLDAQLFAGYHASFFADDQTFNAFVLDRAELGTAWRGRDEVGAELRLEAVRSAGEGSLLGVDGDSLVLRVKRAWAFWGADLPAGLTLRLDGGLVPEPLITEVERTYALRGLAPLLAESGGLFDTSDLGAVLHLTAWDARLRLALSATNGEGRNAREQNEGKTIGATLGLTALRTDAGLDLVLFGVYRDGSVGVGRARDDRFGGGFALRHPDAGLGALFLAADGYAGDSDRRAQGIEAWADARLLWDALGVAVRFERLTFEPGDDAEASRQRVTGALFGDIDAWAAGLQRFRVYLAYENDGADEGASPFPGVPEVADAHRVLLRVEARGSRTF